MPLPKPPAKRASLLNAADFDSQAAPQPGKRPNPKTRGHAEPASPAVLELTDATSTAIANARRPSAAIPQVTTAMAPLAPPRAARPQRL